MLRLVKRRGSPFWYVRGTFAGRAVYASTKAKDKGDARRFARALEVELARSAGQKCHAATFQDAAALYLEAKPHSREPWRANIERLCGVIGDRLLVDIRQHVLVDAANALYPNCKPSSRNSLAFAPAAAVLHYAAENDLCPYVRVKKLKERRPEARAMRKEDAGRLIAAADGKLKLLLVFLFSQGWRIGDALRLQWADINLNEATVWYRISKTDEAMPMPLNLSLLDMLRDEPQPRVGRVFPWRGKSSLYCHIRPLCQKAGIFFTPHMARHSFATWLHAEGASAFEIMKAGAWRDHRSVFRYTSVDVRQVRATINKIRI
jgi:integrase